MTTATHTTAGLQSLAGAARIRVVTGSCPTATPAHAIQASLPVMGGYGHHQSATWTKGAIAEPTTVFAVLDPKNRPSRQPSEISP